MVDTITAEGVFLMGRISETISGRRNTISWQDISRVFGKVTARRYGMDHEALIRRQWPDYEVLGVLGEGTSGRVYEIAHKSPTGEVRYAVKVISSEKATERVRQGGARDEIKQYPEKCVKDLSLEARVMQILKGDPHIVSIEDFAVMRDEESDQDHVLIRMELLKPFRLWREQHGELTQEDIVRLPLDLTECTFKLALFGKELFDQNEVISLTHGARKSISEFCLITCGICTYRAAESSCLYKHWEAELFTAVFECQLGLYRS